MTIADIEYSGGSRGGTMRHQCNVSITPITAPSPSPTTQEDVSELLQRLQGSDKKSLTRFEIVLNDDNANNGNTNNSKQVASAGDHDDDDVQVNWPLFALALRGQSAIDTVYVDLSNASVDTRSGLKSLLPELSNLSALKHVTLRCCNLGPSLCSKLFSSLGATSTCVTTLETLNLSNNPLGPRGARLLAGFLQQPSSAGSNNHKLCVLDVSYASLGSFGAQALGGSLPSSLRVLNLSSNNMGRDGVWKFADMGLTTRLNLLEYLDVSDNQIGDDGCLEIANRLAWLGALKTLNLAHSDIGSIGVEGLASSLLSTLDNSCRRLQSLSLAHNRLDNVAARHLGSVFTKIVCLIHLDLSHNAIGDEGVQSLVEGLLVRKDDQSLQILHLSYNRIGDLGAGAFVEHLESLRGLSTLSLQHNDISEARTRILDMLLKHRQHPLVSASTHTAGSSRATLSVCSSVNETSVDSNFDSEEDDGDELDEEQIHLGREQLVHLLRDHDADAEDDVNRSKIVLLSHQRRQLPLNYLRYLTNDFDKKHLLGYGAFGFLYSVSLRGEREREHRLGGAKLILRHLEIGPAGPFKEVRESILEDLLCDSRRQHAGFLPVLSVTVRASAHYYVLHDVTNKSSLRDLLLDPCHRKVMTLKIRLEILRQIAEVLRYLHSGEAEGGGNVSGDNRSTRRVHGDIQPSNIYVSLNDFSTVQLSGAMMCRLVGTDRRRFKNGDDVIFGSCSYRCPRYERGSSMYDTATEIFSFGIVMAEIFSGKLQRSSGGASTYSSNDDTDGDSNNNSQKRVVKMPYDVYYDVVLAQEPFEFEPLLDESFAQAVPPSSKETLVQVMYSCMSPVVTHRPSSASISRILEQVAI